MSDTEALRAALVKERDDAASAVSTRTGGDYERGRRDLAEDVLELLDATPESSADADAALPSDKPYITCGAPIIDGHCREWFVGYAASPATPPLDVERLARALAINYAGVFKDADEGDWLSDAEFIAEKYLANPTPEPDDDWDPRVESRYP